MSNLHPPVDASTFPFSAVVGADDMALALILTSVSPEVGGVLIRGEKGTAKSTIVRALAQVLPTQDVVDGCRFGCNPSSPDPRCPDGPHWGARAIERPARLIELPIGASEDRVVGSLDLERALSSGVTTYEPGLLANANRGILYVDEVNLLHDHLVDLLLDAAAMGRSTVEREGFSVSHAARVVLVGTMNPEEGELRPQLLDRFGLTVEVSAPTDRRQRTEVIRRRVAFDANPEAFVAKYADQQMKLRARIDEARTLVPQVQLTDHALDTIARVCSGFEVDGMRADIVTTRAAAAHAAWHGRTEITRDDIRAAALLALPHRARRSPFDEPGLDHQLLDRLLDGEEPDPSGPGGTRGATDQSTSNQSTSNQSTSDQTAGEGTTEGTTDQGTGTGGSATVDRPDRDPGATASVSTTALGSTYFPKRLSARSPYDDNEVVHLCDTVRAAAPHQIDRGREDGSLIVSTRDLRHAAVPERASNLVLICVDASGSTAARSRLQQVRSAALSLLRDVNRRRDKVAVVAFRGSGAQILLPPTSASKTAARLLDDPPHGGRTPLAEGLLGAARLIELERMRDPKRRAQLVLVTDGQATAGADAVQRSQDVAAHLGESGLDSVVVDCETGRRRHGLARTLATYLDADYRPAGDSVAATIIDALDPRSRAA